MYTNNSLSEIWSAQSVEQDGLDGLFKTLGKIIKAPIKLAANLAPAVIAGMTGIPIAAVLGSTSPNQPQTGAGGVAISDGDRIAALIAASRQQQAPAYLQPRTGVVQAGFVPTGGGMPGWVIPAAIGGALLLVGVIIIPQITQARK